MKKTPLAFVTAIVITVSMVFAFAGVRRDEPSGNTKVAARVGAISPVAAPVSVQVAVNDVQAEALIVPIDTQADILINEVPLVLGADSQDAQLDIPRPVVDTSPSGILGAAMAPPGDRAGQQTESGRSVQDALADMLTALDRLSQQAAATRQSVTVLVSQYEN